MLVAAQHLKLSSLPPRPFFPKNYPEDIFRKMGGAKGRIVGAGAVFFLKNQNNGKGNHYKRSNQPSSSRSHFP